MRRFFFLIAATLFWNFEGGAEVRLPKILSSHMVLQRDRPIHFWGWADPDEKVSVTLDGQTAETAADKLGKWSLYLPSHAAGGPFRVDVKGSNALTVDDVMIGDVWFASGQSNMEMPLKGFPGNASIRNSEAEIQGANQPNIRLLRIQKKASHYPLMITRTRGPHAHHRPQLIFLPSHISSDERSHKKKM